MTPASPFQRPARTTTLTRARANIRQHSSTDLYGGVEYYSTIKVTPKGSALTSRLPDGRHAPVLDVDRPVTCEPHPDGTLVTVTGSFSVRKVATALGQLVSAGLVHPYTTAMVLDAPVTWWQKALGRFGQVPLLLPYEVVAVPSKTAGHHHLLVQSPMPWDDAKALAKGLANAGVVDARFEKVSALGDFMYVNTPPSLHDAI